MCPFKALYTCAFDRGLHCHEPSPVLGCDSCGQTIHLKCLGLGAIKRGFVSGCSKTPSYSSGWYRKENIAKAVDEVNLQAFLEKTWEAKGARLLTFRSYNRTNFEKYFFEVTFI